MISPALLEDLLLFRRERDWEEFHTPRNLAVALSIEASELLEVFRWSKEADLPALVVSDRTAIERELADVAIFLSYLCHDLGVNLEEAVRTKLEENQSKYPVNLARGKATKYDRL